MITAISPTSFGLWVDDPEAFYLKYLSPAKVRMAQNKPMAVGSAFDAYIKNALHEHVYRDGLSTEEYALKFPTYVLDNLIKTQVEPQNLPDSKEAGKHVFDEYKRLGAYDDLIETLAGRLGKVHFEFDIRETIEGVPLRGFPDLFFWSQLGYRCILDFKVNGYYGAHTTTPVKGYLKLRSQKRRPASYKVFEIENLGGLEINTAFWLEMVSPQWATQLTIYAWTLGEPVGSQRWVAAIEQVLGPATNLRVASHRLRVSEWFQEELLKKLQLMWEVINSDWIFRDLSPSESKRRQDLMDEVASKPTPDNLARML